MGQPPFASEAFCCYLANPLKISKQIKICVLMNSEQRKQIKCGLNTLFECNHEILQTFALLICSSIGGLIGACLVLVVQHSLTQIWILRLVPAERVIAGDGRL